ncbi:PAS domain-containing response regulator [Methanoplanus limicola]|uniref:Putative PAS/PAC sensor protein n=1 Tax=Methanoplanus limicola DSM 2279 TaxID=937775 RepID=H1YYY3_9EURY|nr:response regulator [Methanoplanus limicola]EHQ37055.1 putative PAS/PAC sensor protein [Methanoplanus limicola DSM 2279]
MKLLMVDEEPEILELAGIYLNKYSFYDIDKVYSADKALECLRIKNYDAIVSDYEMPEMDGLTFLKNVRKSRPTIPFIIFSGKGRDEVVVEAFRFGADGFVQKGKNAKANFAELSHQIEIAVARNSAKSELKVKEQAIECSYNGVFLADAETLLVSYVNRSGLSLFNYGAKGEMIGRSLHDFLEIPDEIDIASDILCRVKDKGGFVGELKGRRKDGSSVHLRISIDMITDEATGTDHLFGTFVDITEQKEYEKEFLSYITEAARRIREPLFHISRSLEAAAFSDTHDPEKLRLMLLVQKKNADQVIENLNELNRAITKAKDYIPDEYLEYLLR